MKCIVVEDQAPAQRLLVKYINDLGTLTLEGVYSNGIDAIEHLKKQSVDLIFLDIHLPKLSGIEFLKALSHPPAIILTTAFSEYAVQSYELDVVDYLLKPFSFDRFVKAVAKVNDGSMPKVTKVVGGSPDFFVKSGYDYVKINANDIRYIHSDLDYTEVHLVNQKLLTQEPLVQWEKKLNSDQFIRVHKSYLVNVQKIHKVSGNQIYLEEDIAIPVGRAYKEGFLSRFIR